MQFDVVANIAVAIVAHPALFGSAVCFSYIQQQWKRIATLLNQGIKKISLESRNFVNTDASEWHI
jgi:hypothetical protein